MNRPSIRALIACGLMLVVPLLANAAVWEFPMPVMEGGQEAGHYILILHSRDTTQEITARVTVYAYDRESSREYQFPIQEIRVPAGTVNTVNQKLSRVGSKMVHFRLQEAGFNRLRRVVTRIETSGAPPAFGWAALIADNHAGKVLTACDHRQAFLVRP